MFSIDYKGKTVLVTGKSVPPSLAAKTRRANTVGGGRGIGLAITKAFAEGRLYVKTGPSWLFLAASLTVLAGATIIITYTSKDASPVAAEVSKEFGVPVHVYRCPGEDSKSVDEFVELASKEVGEIDVVVANAGGSPRPME